MSQPVLEENAYRCPYANVSKGLNDMHIFSSCHNSTHIYTHTPKNMKEEIQLRYVCIHEGEKHNQKSPELLLYIFEPLCTKSLRNPKE